MTSKEQKSEFYVIGISCRTQNVPGAAEKDVPAVWAQFMREGIADKIPNKVSDDLIALYTDYEGDYTKPYTFVLGLKVSTLDDVPEGMVSVTVPEGSYAKFSATGEYPANLISVWQQIWSMDADLNRVYQVDYELYGPAFHGPEKLVNVFIGIK